MRIVVAILPGQRECSEVIPRWVRRASIASRALAMTIKSAPQS
jgi:hypothetical protein